jgi:hypothetical protein
LNVLNVLDSCLTNDFLGKNIRTLLCFASADCAIDASTIDLPEPVLAQAITRLCPATIVNFMSVMKLV